MKTFLLKLSVIFIITFTPTSLKLAYSATITSDADVRQVILLNEAEKKSILKEMRMFLDNVQVIVEGISNDNMSAVTKAARTAGLAEQAEIPSQLKKKLPLTFKKLGRDTHKKFDELALDAKDLGDPQHALQQLSILMKNCSACHSLYKFKITN